MFVKALFFPLIGKIKFKLMDYKCIVGLFFACPFLKALDTCPFEPYRKEQFPQRLDVIKNMTFENIIQLEQYHKNCLNAREIKEGKF